MAKGFKSGGKNFPKGKSGNPDGRPPLPPDLKEARKVNQIEFERVANKYLFSTHTELDTMHDRADTPAIDKLIINLIRRGILEGDYKRANFLMERLIGKVKTIVEVTNTEKEKDRLEEMSDQELAKLGRELAKKFKKG